MSNKPNVLKVLTEYLPLETVKHEHERYKTRCPFHEAETASLFVDADSNLWHCFGCGMGGDAFTFVQQIEGVDLEAAAARIEEISGEPVEVPPTKHRPYYVEVTDTGERIAWAKTLKVAFVLIDALVESDEQPWAPRDLCAAPDTSTRERG